MRQKMIKAIMIVYFILLVVISLITLFTLKEQVEWVLFMATLLIMVHFYFGARKLYKDGVLLANAKQDLISSILGLLVINLLFQLNRPNLWNLNLAVLSFIALLLCKELRGKTDETFIKIKTTMHKSSVILFSVFFLLLTLTREARITTITISFIVLIVQLPVMLYLIKIKKIY